MNNGPDYSNYSVEELMEALDSIDREKYPDRVATIQSLLKSGQKKKVNKDSYNEAIDYKKIFKAAVDKIRQVSFKEIFKAALDKTRQLVTISRFPTLDKISVAVCFWFIILPFPYGVLLIVLVALPFIGIVVNGIERPSITTLVNFRKDGKIDVADFIDLPAWVIAIRVFLDYNIDTFSAIAVSGSVMLVLILFVILLTHSPTFPDKIPKKATVLAALIINLALYSYSSVVALNCQFDFSEPILYSTTVIDKHISSGTKRPTRYYLKVRPWGPHKEEENVRVPGYQFWGAAIGDSVSINYHEGLFGIKWYDVDQR